jgi:hypothetical protein
MALLCGSIHAELQQRKAENLPGSNPNIQRPDLLNGFAEVAITGSGGSAGRSENQ